MKTLPPDKFFADYIFDPKIDIFSDSIWKQWGEWRQNGIKKSPCNLGVFLLLKESDFNFVFSFLTIFHLCQFFSPLIGFFWLVPGFVEVDIGSA